MIGLNFGLLGHIADVITRAKFCDNRFRGFGVLIPPILPFSIGIAGRPCNSVSTTVLHFDSVIFYVSVGHCYSVIISRIQRPLRPASVFSMWRNVIITSNCKCKRRLTARGPEVENNDYRVTNSPWWLLWVLPRYFKIAHTSSHVFLSKWRMMLMGGWEVSDNVFKLITCTSIQVSRQNNRDSQPWFCFCILVVKWRSVSRLLRSLYSMCSLLWWRCSVALTLNLCARKTICRSSNLFSHSADLALKVISNKPVHNVLLGNCEMNSWRLVVCGLVSNVS